jgi:peptide/nickel transport system substrate-binding protein
LCGSKKKAIVLRFQTFENFYLKERNTMRTKTLVLVLALMLVAGFAFASGKKAATGASAAPGEPQYGGTITQLNVRFRADPPTPDETMGQFNALPFLLYIQEPLLMGDMEKYGPRGSNEYAFQGRGYLPPQFIRGHLLESWEIDAEKAVLHVRPGIYWQGTNKVKKVMDNREVVAEDIAADINRFWKDAPWGTRFDGMLKKVYATDKYTVVAEFETYSSLFIYYVGYEDRAMYAPPELMEAGADKWENQVGTGPWIFEDYEIGSHMSFVPNPDYWRQATIDGKKYKIPFAERLIAPIIPEDTTQMAALRTGKIDLHQLPPPAQWEILDKTAPGIKYASYSIESMSVTFQAAEPPFDDVKVRRAMNIGTDRKPFAKLGFSEEAPIHWYPLTYLNSLYYTPLEKLPQDIQILYDYNPELAKKMLAEAGYPNGFTVEGAIGAEPMQQDHAALLKDQWAKIGVTLDLKTYDHTTLSSMNYASTYKGITIGGLETVNPLNTLITTAKSRDIGGWANWGSYSNPEVDRLCIEAAASFDDDEVVRLVKEASLIVMRECPKVPLYARIYRHYWWPWLKNYYGELTIADEGPGQLMAYAWIDQALKKEMGK